MSTPEKFLLRTPKGEYVQLRDGQFKDGQYVFLSESDAKTVRLNGDLRATVFSDPINDASIVHMLEQDMLTREYICTPDVRYCVTINIRTAAVTTYYMCRVVNSSGGSADVGYVLVPEPPQLYANRELLTWKTLAEIPFPVCPSGIELANRFVVRVIVNGKIQ